MKTRIILLISAVAVVTLSFTFASRNVNKAEKTSATTTVHHDEPVGGFVSEDKL